jgi:hypothetical protein
MKFSVDRTTQLRSIFARSKDRAYRSGRSKDWEDEEPKPSGNEARNGGVLEPI